MELRGYRLSPQQRHLWKVSKGKERGAYVTQSVMEIEGEMDRERLKGALDGVIERHEILRTRYEGAEGMEPLQVIEEGVEVELREGDISGERWEVQGGEIEREMREEAEGGINLREGPVVKVKVIKRGERRHDLIVTISGMSGDRETMRMMKEEIGRGYGGEEVRGEVMQYADVSEWANEMIESEETGSGRRYWEKKERWREEKVGMEERRGEEYRVEVKEREIGEEKRKRMEEGARRMGVREEEVMGAALSLLVWGWGGRGVEEVETGVRRGGRTYEGMEKGMGLYMRILPVRVKIEGEKEVREVVKEYGERVREVEEWQDYYSWGEGGEEGEKYVRVVLEMSEEGEEEEGGGIREGRVREVTDRIGVKVRCVKRGKGMRVEWHYDGRKYREESVRRMMEEYEKVVEEITGGERRRVREIEMVGEEEREELVRKRNESEKEYERGKRVEEVIREKGKERGERIALEYENEEESYGELEERSNKKGRWLKRKGVRREERIGLMVRRGIRMVEWMIGIMKAGGVYVPIEESNPEERIREIVEDSGIKRVIVGEGKGEGLGEGVERIREEEEEVEEESGEEMEREGSSEELAYVLYTSGSTGRPKGVMVSHRALMNYLSWSAATYCDDQGYGSVVHSPIGFDLTVTSLFSPLVAGETVRLLAESEGIEGLAQALQDQGRYSLLKITPSHLRALGNMLEGSESKAEIKSLVIGGEQLTSDAVHFSRVCSPRTVIHNEYGPTETVVGCCVYSALASELMTGTVPIGEGIWNTRLYVLDEEMKLVPTGATGELYIGGEGLSRGYLGRGDQTGEKYVPEGLSGREGERMYRTGDEVRYVGGGNLEFVGRRDEQVKIRGYRIELGEVEAALRREEGVEEAVVLVREDEPGEKRLVGYVVRKGGVGGGGGEIRERLRGRLPEYMVPVVVEMERMPVNKNGKIERKELPRPEKVKGEYVKARSEGERELVRIWEEALGREGIGIRDNFFEMGGDSIVGIQIVARANEGGMKLKARQIFEHQTIEELAKAGEGEREIEAEQGRVEGEAELTPIQEMFFEMGLEEESQWNQAVMVELEEGVSSEEIREVVEKVGEHHDAMRLRYRREGGRWRGRSEGREEGIRYRVKEVRGEGEKEEEEEIREEIKKEQRGLDIERGPMARVCVMEMRGGRRKMLIVMHHLIVDAVSWRILMEDVERGWEQKRRGEEIELARKTTSYVEWGRRLRELGESEEMREEEEYWEGEGKKEVRRIRVDKEGEEGEEEEERGAKMEERELSEEETRRLVEEVGGERVQVEEILLGALEGGLERWMGEGRVRVDIEGHGREEVMEGVDVTRTVGWFTVVYPKVLEVVRGEGVVDRVKRVRKEKRELRKKGIGYGLLRYKAGREEMRGGKESEISFNYFGRVEERRREGGLIKRRMGGVEWSRGERNRRRYKIEINGGIGGGRLRMSWRYSEGRYKKETIEELADGYMEELRKIIEEWRGEQTIELSPSDFPLAGLSQNELERVFGEVEFDQP